MNGRSARNGRGCVTPAERLDKAHTQAEALAERIRKQAAVYFTPLTKLCGISLLTAGRLAGILGPGRRFATDAALASVRGSMPDRSVIRGSRTASP